MATPKAKTPKLITPQKVRAVLRKAGLRPSYIEFIPGYLWVGPECGWDSTRGGWVYEDDECIRIAAALTAVGIMAEVRDGTVWVPVDQDTQPEESH
jgi:hypothetical protein